MVVPAVHGSTLLYLCGYVNQAGEYWRLTLLTYLISYYAVGGHLTSIRCLWAHMAHEVRQAQPNWAFLVALGCIVVGVGFSSILLITYLSSY